MNTISEIIFIQDLMSLPKSDLKDICTDLNLEDSGYKGDLAGRIYSSLNHSKKTKNDVLENYKNKIFAGKTSLTWFKLNNMLSKEEFKNLIRENHSFDPFETTSIPPLHEISTEPFLIGGSDGNNNNDVFLRFIHKSGVNEEPHVTEITTTPKTSLSTVYYHSDSGILELRGDSRKGETIAKIIARLLKQQVSLERIETPFYHKIDDIANNLGGALIDAKSKPEMLLEDLDEDKIKAVANVLTALDNYFNTENAEELETQLQQANNAFDDYKFTVPFSALILSGMEEVGLSGEKEIRGLPLFDYLNPNLQHQNGYIRFNFVEDGFEKPFTIRVGMKSQSIYFSTRASEQVIAYVREQVII
ncbi:hypothetical protein GCM10008983_01550 [Lentibacillus halophilus]|uniref:SAP domain-containing protein n=1 Tax=Lentibacillus halophilus TaxID=295065 RepID=A0ABP3IXZ2_9BACI